MKHRVISERGKAYMLEYVSNNNIKLLGEGNIILARLIVDRDVLTVVNGEVSDAMLFRMAREVGDILHVEHAELLHLSIQGMLKLEVQ